MKKLVLTAISFIVLCTAAFAQQTHNASTPKDPASVPLPAEEKGTVIAGAAIATALMPPLCTAGYGIATGSFAYFIGACYLYFINSVFIRKNICKVFD